MLNSKTINTAGWNLDNSYARLPNEFFQKLSLKPVASPEMVVFNSTLASSLGLDAQALQEEGRVDIFAGNNMPEGAVPLAQAYAGHQFGTFRMLGDGRAMLIGEQITPEGKRFDIQLKGSGETNYSRGMDGRAALGPMLREYIISEAMHGLGIPTTRSLAVVKTGESIVRETPLTGAVMTRVASSHLRVGTFQYAAEFGNADRLRALADYTIKRHFPEIDDEVDRYLQLFREIIHRQAHLVARWKLVGFVHGVMSTDNMSISGETIDYGPCAFLDSYDPEAVFSSKDVNGRYAFDKQAQIAEWNLGRLGESLVPILHEEAAQAKQLAQDALSEYTTLFQQSWLQGMRKKLGIFNEEQQDETLIENLLNMMAQHQADFTNTFRSLTLNQSEDIAMMNTKEFEQWYQRWQERLDRQQESSDESQVLMKNNNPAVIPRNHRVEEALEAAVDKGDYSVMEKLVKVLSNPYAYTPGQEEYSKPDKHSDQPYVTYCGT